MKNKSLQQVKKWQWLYKIEHSICWNITPSYLTKEHMKQYIEDFNQSSSRKIIDFGKAKVSRLDVTE